jgi:hypothetical protein
MAGRAETDRVKCRNEDHLEDRAGARTERVNRRNERFSPETQNIPELTGLKV